MVRAAGRRYGARLLPLLAGALAAIVTALPAAALEPERSGRPPPMPQEVSAAGRSPTEIAVTWAAPAAPAGIAGFEVIRDDQALDAGRGTSFTDRELSPWTQYCYAVRAYDAEGRRSVVSKSACARTLDVVAPTRPAQLHAAAVDPAQVVLLWAPATDDAGIAGYELSREGRPAFARVAETRAAEDGLRPWTVYCYTVRALDPAGNRSEPSEPACVMTPDLAPPAPPPALGARARSDRAIELSWAPSADDAGVERYEVFRGQERIASGPATQAVDGDLAAGRSACYEVVAVDGAGNRSKPARACASTPDLTPPSAPGELAAAALSASEVALQFAPATDDVGVVAYEVLRGPTVVARVTSPRAAEAGLRAGADHCYRVRAVDAAGHRSAESEEACAQTPADGAAPTAPRNVRAAAVADGVALEWEPGSARGVVYSVSRENDRPLGATRGTSFVVRPLKPGEHHCYRVSAVDAAGRFSSRSLPACAAPADPPAGLRPSVAAAPLRQEGPLVRD